MRSPLVLAPACLALVLGLAPSARADQAQTGKPLTNYFEVGVFGGAIFPAEQHNFHDENRPHQSFKSIAPELGGRVAYFPLSMLGAEVEGAVAPTKTKDDDGAAGLWALRAHALGQLPLGGLTPFALIGMSRLGAGSNSLGSDSDPALHFGAGVKVPLDDFLGLRLDLRDNLTQKNGGSKGQQAHHPEVLLGLTFTLDLRKKEKPAPKDSDGDGIADDADKCPKEPGIAPDGCPKAPDSDADEIADAEDACPNEAGPKSEDATKHGCPLPKDSDGDGFADGDDKCPNQAGIAPDGCPDPDPDKDGVIGPNDKCPTEAETANGYQDADGCPDEIPAEVKKFTGVIQGIEFDTGKATIRPKSKPVLDEALKVLRDNPDVRIEVSGHTDDVGDAKKNVELSQKRADAVKEYFVSQGVDAARITTRGAGPDQPIADNKTAEGKQKNRRIEFKLLTQ
ncbi:MAG: OmpA family protein [Polyangiaceae bacterium]|nr:OmpA family protein [Polyangiaceae bacterium]MCE7891087.1 OmpA family protein [Sorangiineae bacterium PRO1]MCL4750591.1 OmpA family protein [Myxococcales bacterium]